MPHYERPSNVRIDALRVPAETKDLLKRLLQLTDREVHVSRSDTSKVRPVWTFTLAPPFRNIQVAVALNAKKVTLYVKARNPLGVDVRSELGQLARIERQFPNPDNRNPPSFFSVQGVAPGLQPDAVNPVLLVAPQTGRALELLNIHLGVAEGTAKSALQQSGTATSSPTPKVVAVAASADEDSTDLNIPSNSSKLPSDGLSEEVGRAGALNHGSRSKVTRLSFNSAGWTRPTGEAARQEDKDTYNAVTGFGHEDWLFRDEWHLDGWRYAFLQGVNKSHSKLVRDRTPFDVTLFTVHPDKSRSFVAHVSEMECLSDEQADAALAAFKEQGWVAAMIREVAAIGGDTRALGSPQWARHMLNVRFRIENVQRMSVPVEKDDPVMRLQRYMLYDASNVGDGGWLPPTRRRSRAGQTEPPTQAPYLRNAMAPVICTPEHGRMQALLLGELRSEHPGADILCEEDFVDVVVRSADDEVLYEIKTDLSPKTVLRQAIGQLLEYGHHGERRAHKNLRFVAVGRNPLSDVDEAYLAMLTLTYGLPLAYRWIPL